MIQGKAVVDDVITTQAEGVEAKGGDTIIPNEKHPTSPAVSSSKYAETLSLIRTHKHPFDLKNIQAFF